MSFNRITAPKGGIALDYTHEGETHRDVDYASVTAPGPCFVTIEVTRKDGTPEIVDGVHIAAGGSHSWWAGAHGKLLRRGLNLGDRVRVVGDAPFAFRWDWMDE